jgi:DNA helicase-2/ATP-dependent DNA helicase PcrA
VTLMTVHSAKGLEFPVVYVVNLADDIFPHHRALAEGAEEEERRLFYVAITRARRHLVLSMARQRRRFGDVVPQLPSRFVLEIAAELFDGNAPHAGAAPTAVQTEDRVKQARARFFDEMRNRPGSASSNGEAAGSTGVARPPGNATVSLESPASDAPAADLAD